MDPAVRKKSSDRRIDVCFLSPRRSSPLHLAGERRNEKRLCLTKNVRRSIYQFLIAVRQQDGQNLMNENGEVTR